MTNGAQCDKNHEYSVYQTLNANYTILNVPIVLQEILRYINYHTSLNKCLLQMSSAFKYTLQYSVAGGNTGVYFILDVQKYNE